jgi:glycogen operon protein
MADEAWTVGYARCLGVRLAGDIIGDVDERGEPIVGDTLLMLLNAHHEPIEFMLPITHGETDWELVLDTALAAPQPDVFKPHARYKLEGRSLAVLRTGISDERVAELEPARSIEVTPDHVVDAARLAPAPVKVQAKGTPGQVPHPNGGEVVNA